MIKNLYFRRDGTPYPPGHEGMMEWAKDFENMELRRVGQDFLPNGIEVSTVWLGLDHNYAPRGRPLIFETMLFVAQKKEIEIFGRIHSFDREEIGDQWRYSTEEEALRGHKMLVKKWSKFKNASQLLEEIYREKKG